LSLGFANAQVASQKTSVNHSDRMLFEQAQQAVKEIQLRRGANAAGDSHQYSSRFGLCAACKTFH
jgi:hypothetical protein